VPTPAPSLPPPSRPSPSAPTPRTPAPATAPVSPRTHVVRPGDNLWLIARAELHRRGGARPDDAAIARYLDVVIAANVASLRSGDPNLIFPGEVVALPEPV
jgi:nucleoid-associated protein YgaU